MGLLHCLLPYVQGIISETELPTMVLQKIQFSEVMLCNSQHLHLQVQSVQNKQLHWEVRVYVLEASMRGAERERCVLFLDYHDILLCLYIN